MTTERIAEFDLWRGGYGGATVHIYLANTTTLASVYTDEALSVSAANPQVLSSLTINNVVYGKFALPLYVAAAYYLDVVAMDQTGIIRPAMTTLVGQTADGALVTPSGGSVANTLSDLHGREVYVEDTAHLGVSAATNSTTITTAMGRPAAAGGGKAYLPDNTSIVFNQLTVPGGVSLVGRGRTGLPSVIQSQIADKAITLGDGSGLENVVVDGINNVASGIAIYSKAKNETVLNNVLIKRFATGIKQLGGRRANWKELYIDSCGIGGDFRGDLDGSGGDQWRDNSWHGGTISNCTTTGLSLSYTDKVVTNVALHNVGFESNTGTALSINGARFVHLEDCHFSGNTSNLAIADDDLTTVTDNTVWTFRMTGGSISGGTVTFNGSSRNIILERVDLSNVAFTCTNVTANILLIDCKEDSQVTFAGQGTRITRKFTELGDAPGTAAVTTDATPLATWQITLNPGEKGWLEAKVIGVMRNGVDYGLYHIGRAVHRPGSQLVYKTQTVNFTKGALLTGTTSGAVGRIIADTDGGTTGTLVLKDIAGIFIDNEAITDSSGGAAVCNGTLVPQNAVLLGSTTPIEAAVETVDAYGADFVANTGNIEVQVTGAAATTLDWVTNVTATLN